MTEFKENAPAVGRKDGQTLFYSTLRATAGSPTKKTSRSSFYTSVPKIMIIFYTVPEVWCVIDVIVLFHFGLFFALLSPLPLNSSKN